MKNQSSRFLTLTMAAILLALNSLCPGRVDAAQPTPTITQLAVMPFLTAGSSAQQSKELTQTLDCAISGLCTLPGSTLSHAEQTVTRQMHEALTERLPDQLLPQQDMTNAFLAMAKQPEETPRDLAERFGQQVKADYVLIGIIWRFDQRVGENLSAERPASVAFTSYLVKVDSKELVWEDSFEKTQSALSDNLLNAVLFFKTGVKWLSAEELSEVGVSQILKTFPAPQLD